MAKTKYYVEYPSSSIKYEIEQSTHGFTVGIAIANSGGTWIKASSDDDEKLGRLVVESVEDTNNFTVVESGEIILTGLTEGSYYVVDDSGDGSLVEFSEGLSYDYSNPILQAVSSSKAHVLPWRPSVQGDNTSSVGGVMTSDLLMSENTAILQDPALSADGTYTGTARTGTAGNTLSFGELCYLDPTDSRWEKCDANAAAGADGDSRGIIGICVLAASSDGSSTKMLLFGTVRADAAFPTLTVNGQVYVSETAGDITMTSPTTTDVVVRVVGFGLTVNELYFNPSPDHIIHA